MAAWTSTNALWQVMTPYQRAAAMSIMEAGFGHPGDSQNVLAAMINRSRADKTDLGTSVSSRIYQPTFEPAQEARLERIVRDPQFLVNTVQAQRWAEGADQLPHSATHFLAPESTMLALEKQDPGKYRSWRKWTGYDENGGQYRNVVLRDGSHVFLTPDGEAGPAPTTAYPKNIIPVDHDPFDVYHYANQAAATQTLMGQDRTFNPEMLAPATVQKPTVKKDPTAQIFGTTQVLPSVSLTPVEHDPFGSNQV